MIKTSEQLRRTNQLKYGKRMITLDQAVPDETKERLIFLGNQESDLQWESGDITDALLKYVADDPMVDADDMLIYAFVAGLLGCGESTIRYRVYTCREFTHAERDRYYPALTFKHFFTAKQYGDRKFDVLDACMRYMDEHNGKRPRVDWITRNFRGVDQVDEAIEREEYNDYEQTTDVINPDGTHWSEVGVWKSILTQTEIVRMRLFEANVSANRREELGQMLDDFETEIYAELEQ